LVKKFLAHIDMALHKNTRRNSISQEAQRTKKKRSIYLPMSKILWGMSANSHDAALAVFESKSRGLVPGRKLSLKFSSHSERFSGIKNDPHLDQKLIDHVKELYGEPDEIVWYEKPLAKTFRQLWAGQGLKLAENNVRNYLAHRFIHAPVSYVSHHHAHAAGSYYTSGFGEAAVACIDSIGEFDTVTFWQGRGTKLQRLHSQSYPNSVGLWYSAMTQRVGLTPNEDEYILMGMAAYGDPDRLYSSMVRDFIAKWPIIGDPKIKFKMNLHRGCMHWSPELTSKQDMFDIAAATQKIYQEIFEFLLQDLSVRSKSKNLVLTGGCALNCSANHIAKKYFDCVWIMPNPGDAGSAIGSVLARYQTHIPWPGPYLGYNIKGEYPVADVIKELLENRICGVANGPAEFGPRALGNRSLLADPRGADIRDTVNSIKQRQQFRPFAPAILSEYADQYFDGITGPYMQYTATCRNPELYPAVCHADGTSRVQTVAKDDPGSRGFRSLLEHWYSLTGCPMLLNTSLNIKGQPIVNTVKDSQQFEKQYGVRVCT
jgi:carbamoyltransferase